jgi:hypothetical protein
VVISIVALLIGLLLPVLGKAREAARSTVCLANMRTLSLAQNVYVTDHDGYFAGPNTSGLHLNSFVGGSFGQSVAGNKSSDDPMTADDWMSPMLGNYMDLPKNRKQRLIRFFNHDFRCPTNVYRYDSVYGGGGGWPKAGETFVNSYSMPMTFQYFWNASHAVSRGYTDRAAYYGNQYDRLINTRPSNFNFRVETIGQASIKVAFTEGSRYVDTSGRISFNTDAGSRYGGNFVNRSPTINVKYQGNGNPYKFAANGRDLHRHSVEHAYRHQDEQMNFIYFDGHGDMLGHRESRDVDMYFPSGAEVRKTNGLGDSDARVGDVIE